MTAYAAHAMPFGAMLLPGGGTRFRLWAPGSALAKLELSAASNRIHHRMQAIGDGWHEVILSNAPAGTRYQFVVQPNDAQPLVVPDPASRSNPEGVHCASVVIDPHAYTWSDEAWRGRPWTEAVVYELHVGSFTPEGTFAAARRRLADLVDLGITALQLMPLAAFPGRRNWGYDGVLPFAPAACYGSPDELKALIDTAHSLGLMMLLDVVYNHFGPDGNYLHTYCPQFFNPAHRTPWGAAINFDGERNRLVRDFFVHNALFWVEEYRFDGLRLDAVHAIRDQCTPDIVCEIARALHGGPGIQRHVHLVLENNANQSRYLERDMAGEPMYATAQWDDDVHHALHVLITGETDGYYADYAAAPLDHLGRSLAEGFAYQGQHSSFRNAVRGEPSSTLPPVAFVGFLQNHDTIGNRAFGDRIHTLADERLLAAAYVCLLLTPEVPMLFMGEEFAASTPFLFFCDFGAELAQAVSNGRRHEFKPFAAFVDDAACSRIPDPNAELTFNASKLRWDERDRSPHRERLALVRELLALRQRYLAPRLANITHGGHYVIDGGLLRIGWRFGDGSCWRLLAHFGTHDAYAAAPPAGETVHSTGVHGAVPGRIRLEPGAVVVTHGPAHVSLSEGGVSFVGGSCQ
jgi:maltooligosyltrehalose trehalohydrolase